MTCDVLGARVVWRRRLRVLSVTWFVRDPAREHLAVPYYAVHLPLWRE